MSLITMEIATWLNNITQSFGQNGETGVDIGMPSGTPIYAITGGPVLGAGYYGGGGVVSIGSTIDYAGINGPATIYYQHLSHLFVQPGQVVYPGEQIGTSGGGVGDLINYNGVVQPAQSQSWYGGYSSGPHIEVGINAPYGGMWAPQGPNVNPLGFLQGLAGGNTSMTTSSSAPSVPILSGLWGIMSYLPGGSYFGNPANMNAVQTGAQTVANAAPNAFQAFGLAVNQFELLAIGTVVLAIGLIVLLHPNPGQLVVKAAKTAAVM